MFLRTVKSLAAGAALFLGSTAAWAEVEIEYWQYFFDARVTAMEQLIENFQAANPDIKVTDDPLPLCRLPHQGRRRDPGGRRSGRGAAVLRLAE